MAAQTQLWGELGFNWIGTLDYGVVQYDSQWIGKAADLVEASNVGPMGHEISSMLRALAETPAAVGALNHHTERAPGKLFGLNVAVHYLAVLELRGERYAKEAKGRVADTWGVDALSVGDYVADHRDASRKELESIIALVRSRPDNTDDRAAVLVQVDRVMRDTRAKLPWFGRRKAKKAARRYRKVSPRARARVR